VFKKYASHIETKNIQDVGNAAAVAFGNVLQFRKVGWCECQYGVVGEPGSTGCTAIALRRSTTPSEAIQKPFLWNYTMRAFLMRLQVAYLWTFFA